MDCTVDGIDEVLLMNHRVMGVDAIRNVRNGIICSPAVGNYARTCAKIAKKSSTGKVRLSDFTAILTGSTVLATKKYRITYILQPRNIALHRF